MSDYTAPIHKAASNGERTLHDPRQKEAVEAVGGSRLLAIRSGLLPQVLPVLLAPVLYGFESSTRSAAILGVVGAGGTGLQIAERIKVRYWDEVSFIIIVILLTVAAIDQMSARVWRRLIGRGGRSAVRTVAQIICTSNTFTCQGA